MPQLEADRDRLLLELLPEYLIDDIPFSRENASKFYQRLTYMLVTPADKLREQQLAEEEMEGVEES